ncbi:UDP-N-acetylmuramoyl-tripeptide--D-alanyl-D-alanine ligase [Pseudobacteroides cellulosolvens]|uniref:UDP-N-acetylmuramoyl-tripeptide--D-alanyl-D-alanine ligase n=1 Tax=Pseudobacteroides cellulosolvens ATCC 35603 = DSM 2933 TaxID=398512 RepID=A0A0L6JGD6_9FIRM|nr:UDP-N-acetylmuramoyl-tripeptide--D-alanyl-D-alanine ligase [Pseudobacteroides cellulosolvens]KNY24941.1 UDP-N-acetylmuramoylalanyl-D-glutamyl-2,6-diaminopimelate/D-alanyl-D-alanyl ligase [Pseudobacteroides cellulosolvens ATCC 35603 = DSM 2933]
MQTLGLKEIIEATKGELIFGELEKGINGICTDSRKVVEGSLFIPIKGENFDGHAFIKDCLMKGAAASLTSEDVQGLDVMNGKAVIKVQDTLAALGDIARYYRALFNIPLVGITGSVGKTSTKDMIACVLQQKFNILKTSGNFNNHIGLPLTVMNMERDYEAAVLEMGMSGLGEISYLTKIAKPSIAVITNIGMSHIEKLGSKQNILKAKMEIMEGLPDDGIVILNGDDSLLYGLKGYLKYKTVYYGTEDGLDLQAYNIKTMGESGTCFEVTIGNNDYKVHIPVPGTHNVYNALAAIAVGLHMGISIESIIKGIASYSPANMRLNIVGHKGYKIINDAYNASPQSMESALDVLKDTSEGNRTIAVLGDMLEMGEWAYKAHVGVGKYVASKEINYLVTVGENGRNIAHGALEAGIPAKRVFSFRKNDEVKEFLKNFVEEGDFILIKGSRGMKMEEIAQGLME